jgi:hypothetical protein
MTVNQFFQDGTMEKLELSYHNLVNSSMLLMMLITMELLLLHPLITVKELYQEVWKVKLEYGELENKHKLWKLHLKNTEEELLILKLTEQTHKQYQQATMVHVLSGT